MKYPKLVRDRVPEVIAQSGKKAQVRFVKGQELLDQLKDKLKEEVDEFLSDEAIEELADILEVVYALSHYLGVDQRQLDEFRKLKAQERGTFKDGVILEKVL
ncbi:TPA: hypothetical protein DIC20_03170 [Candidatus Dependentiae bacterium]|nr:MAG: Phosphoribosyl-ATP pyrophosphohydrolase domain protein [candidate division TM6 bacterium GW2011_GWF2_36_131]KKQ03840.1 MAG: Phosphoribosyl-ATP pyrophosphohydrolase domain protein [candidate division TM6 bacterium GW2011_GWE2_36_25]KKQ19451.1 MAG: Phosphoribosyl-ATP pyrophosphohydrolase domain protein [candidate division TM6 bacterium GW2011_GWA2_36_9]HBR70608.1 hypothetical protein [Candidatus Dependentiae bacterium]HCU00677.1 hypothetical protein [Candidatus Dependentiae bacterium]